MVNLGAEEGKPGWGVRGVGESSRVHVEAASVDKVGKGRGKS